MKTGLEKRHEDSEHSVINSYLVWMQAGAQTKHGSSSVHMHSGFPTLLVEQTIVTSLNDVMRISHAIEGGKYKRGSATKLKEFSCCYYCHLGVSTQVLGSLQSHRPSTLAVSVPLE